MPHFYYYRRALLYAVKWVALLIFVVSALIFFLILCDIFLRFDWGYPWWSTLLALALIAISLTIRREAATALRQMKRK
jgi:ABC-type transport system involved in cytochrome c biogenesis permease component